MRNLKKCLDKISQYMQAENLNEQYNLLTKEQKEKVKISVKKYHQPIKIAIQQALIFNRISCNDINEFLRINGGL